MIDIYFKDRHGNLEKSVIQVKYEKLKFHDLFNRSMEMVFVF